MNVPPRPIPSLASWSLVPPLSVTLQHLCIERSDNARVTAVSTTLRFRSKFVTIVIYKPFVPAMGSMELGYALQQGRDVWLARGAGYQRAAHGEQGQQGGGGGGDGRGDEQGEGQGRWSDGDDSIMQPSGGSGPYAGSYVTQGQMMPPPPPQRDSHVSPAAFEPLSTAESMDLVSRPNSHSHSMDTSADWNASPPQ